MLQSRGRPPSDSGQPGSTGCEASINDDNLARHVAACIRTEEQRRTDHFVGVRGTLRKHAFFMDSIVSGGLFRTMSVSTVPGARVFTRMPFGAKTAAIERVMDISPAFAAAYIAVVGREQESPSRDDVQDCPFARILQVGSARSTRNTGPRRFVPRDLSHACGASWPKASVSALAASFTTMSMRPNCSTERSRER